MVDSDIVSFLSKRHSHSHGGEEHSHHHGDELPECGSGNDSDGKDGLRIASIFVILVTSAVATYFPLLSARYTQIGIPEWVFFCAKYFGSGVIISTGFIHLLQHAHEDLSAPCLGGTFAEYPWAFGICMMSLFTLFFVEINTHYFLRKNASRSDHAGDHHDVKALEEQTSKDSVSQADAPRNLDNAEGAALSKNDHFGHDSYHQDVEQARGLASDNSKEQYLGQLIALFILEFGVVFHSVLIGLALAVTSSDEFTTLFIVLIFHQMFEGLGLGTRISEIKWERGKKFTPWALGTGYAVSTPIAIAIGLGVKESFSPNSREALIVNGVFDALSAGILIYTGLVELMAHEFLFSNAFKGEQGYKRMVLGFVMMATGAGLMSLLGKWA